MPDAGSTDPDGLGAVARPLRDPLVTDDDRTDRARGALLGTFVGDALGMPYEGRGPHAIPAVLEMVDARLGPGTYTDDTQMMIALAESLLRCDVVDPEDVAGAFRTHYEPARGYGAGTTRVLELWQQGESVDDAARRVFGGQGSLGNGAAMRVAPVAIRFAGDNGLLATQAGRSARVTHAHPVGIDGAVVQAAAVAAALAGEDPLAAAIGAARTRELREAMLKVHDCASLTGPATSSAEGSVPLAIAAARGAATFEEAVTQAVRAGGDTDTTGAMAGAIAGARFGASAIPSRWLDVLEDGDHGRSHVASLAEQLHARAGGGWGTTPRDGCR